MKADRRSLSRRPEEALVVLSPAEVARYGILAERSRNEALFGALRRFFHGRTRSAPRGTRSAGTRPVLPAE